MRNKILNGFGCGSSRQRIFRAYDAFSNVYIGDMCLYYILHGIFKECVCYGVCEFVLCMPKNFPFSVCLCFSDYILSTFPQVSGEQKLKEEFHRAIQMALYIYSRTVPRTFWYSISKKANVMLNQHTIHTYTKWKWKWKAREQRQEENEKQQQQQNHNVRTTLGVMCK